MHLRFLLACLATAVAIVATSHRAAAQAPPSHIDTSLLAAALPFPGNASGERRTVEIEFTARTDVRGVVTAVISDSLKRASPFTDAVSRLKGADIGGPLLIGGKAVEQDVRIRARFVPGARGRVVITVLGATPAAVGAHAGRGAIDDSVAPMVRRDMGADAASRRRIDDSVAPARANEAAGDPADYLPEPSEFTAVTKDPHWDPLELQRRVRYPEEARRNGIQGTVIVRGLVDSKGKVRRTLIDRCDNGLLEKAAVDAVMNTPFTPAYQGNKPVAVWVQIPVIFRLR